MNTKFIGTDKKSILVYGAGSIGCFIAAKLKQFGHDVDVLGREKARQIGSKLYINDKEYQFPEIITDNQIKPYYNYVFVTSKFYDLRKNLESLNKLGLKYDCLILIQNTFVDDLWYYNLIKSKPICLISVFDGFNLEGNRLVYNVADGMHLENDIQGKDIGNLLMGADISVKYVDDIRVNRAEKTVVNCAINVLSAMYEVRVSDLFSKRDYLIRMKKIFDEAYNVMSNIVPIKARRALWTDFSHSWKNTMHYTSTYQDVKRGKKTEVSFLNGFIVENGRKMGFDVSENQKLIADFKQKYPNLY